MPLTPDGFLPFIGTDLEDYAGVIGVRGNIGGWNADFSLGYGHNSFDYTVSNTLNTSFGTTSQRVFDAGGLRYGQFVANFDVSHEYNIGLAGPLSVAAGLEYRSENFQIRPGDLQSYATGPLFRPSFATTAVDCAAQGGVYNGGTGICSFPGRAAPAGAQGFPGIPAASATDEGRHSYAAYVEFDADLAEGFTAVLAGRYEHFSDFGDTLNGKLALRYELAPGFALRGSISNGFRAPSLHQQFFTTTSTNFINGLPVDISTLAVDSPVARALGSSDLEPEKSLNLSIGATANPLTGLTFTIDYYQIDIDNRIVLTENLGAAGSGTAAVNAAVKAVLDANGFQSVGAARFFINGLDTRTRGVDAVLTYRLRTQNVGNWTLTAAYNYNKTRIQRRINDLGPLATIPGIVLFGRVEGIRFTDGQPRDKVVLSADGELGDFGLNLRTTRFGRVISPGATAPIADPASLTLLGPDDITLGPKWITDVELRYRPIEQLELAIGANNVFDVYPDRSPFGARPASIGGQYPINQYYLPYSGFSPFGFNGRFLYGRVSIEFCRAVHPDFPDPAAAGIECRIEFVTGMPVAIVGQNLRRRSGRHKSALAHPLAFRRKAPQPFSGERHSPVPDAFTVAHDRAGRDHRGQPAGLPVPDGAEQGFKRRRQPGPERGLRRRIGGLRRLRCAAKQQHRRASQKPSYHARKLPEAWRFEKAARIRAPPARPQSRPSSTRMITMTRTVPSRPDGP